MRAVTFDAAGSLCKRGGGPGVVWKSFEGSGAIISPNPVWG
ncbi:MAG: hypothetical protein ABSG41_23760 [Bryobacteraceae bacterium]